MGKSPLHITRIMGSSACCPALRTCAGRSFNDLAQWPVFPWVLSNWVGAVCHLIAKSYGW